MSDIEEEREGRKGGTEGGREGGREERRMGRQWAFLLGFPGGAVVKNLPANAGDSRDLSSHSSLLAWKIP